MEDVMHIQSAFLRSVIAQAISKTARKQGYKSTAVKLNDIFAGYSETEKKVHLHLDIDAEQGRPDGSSEAGRSAVTRNFQCAL